MGKPLCHMLIAALFAEALLSNAVADAAAGRRAPRPAPVLAGASLADMVNPLMGTASEHDLSYGNTYPEISLPWGMNAWTPMTGKMGDGWGYTYDAHKIRGIKQTHQPSPWMNDYGAFSLLAETGPLKIREDERASWFSHKAETSHPYGYKVYLADYDVTAEVTPTQRAATFRFTFPDAAQAHILIDAFDGGSMVKVLPAQRRIVGYSRNNHGGVPGNFRNYFVAEFDKDFDVVHTWGDDWSLSDGVAERSGNHVGAVVSFRTRKGEQVHVRVASSFISAEQAQINLDREIGTRGFDALQAQAKQAWEKELGRIRVEDPDLDAVRTFYSCLYRMLLFPRAFHEVDAQGRTVHYSPYDGKVHPGFLYTDNGFWDTFRAVFPYLALMYPTRDSEIMQGLVNTYRESGWLPEWASPGHRDVMIGSNSAINISDAWLKGVRGFDIETLFEAMKKNATSSADRPRDGRGNVISAVGREGVEYYNRLGYVPYDIGINENAARTLEYATADFTISEVAKSLGKSADAAWFGRHAYNYRNVFDPSVGWMRGRNADGSFQAPFNLVKWGDAFTEGNSLHYSWSVMQDVQGLIDLMGGKDAFVGKLDQVFAMPPIFDASYYGAVIHEIREMQIVNMGNYAHGNQPIQHMLYLYAFAGQPSKGQAHLRQVMRQLYSATPDGYPGDEDNGQTSAWYVFSALGFYPVTPGSNQYVIGSPLFRRATIRLPNGRSLVIDAPDNTPQSPYIGSAALNGRRLDRSWITHRELLAGGTLRFTMQGTPNKAWAGPNAVPPFSMSTSRPH